VQSVDITSIGQFLQDSIVIIAICLASAVAGAIALLVVASAQIAEIEIPENADFFGTLQAIPITIPLALDLLDGAFDIFSAPISWIILEMLGLQKLQAITIFEGLIPGTQLIPTMSAAWVISRIMKKRQSQARTSLNEYQIASRAERYAQLRGRREDLADQYRRKSLGSGLSPDNVIEGEVVDDDYYDEQDARYEREYRREEDVDAPLEYFDDEDGDDF
jgi:hypothetical protein